MPETPETPEEREIRANKIALVVANVEITQRDLAIIKEADKRGGTAEVYNLEHPTVKQVIVKGLVRSCKLRCGPLALPVDEPGITLTAFGKQVVQTWKDQQ